MCLLIKYLVKINFFNIIVRYKIIICLTLTKLRNFDFYNIDFYNIIL